ncbi:MAG: cytochrome c biogenesis protein CcsA [Muribaculaceae bacterium]|nr:cytochrome c biogenesis protein CcsA [Muribaculaceae bacterium]
MLMVAASLLLLLAPLVCGLRLLTTPWQWLAGLLLVGVTTVLLLPADPSLPVLRTPWLVIHLVPLVAAYALMPVGLWLSTVILLRRRVAGALVGRLRLLMQCMALLLTLGIALGAAWASLSWGRFWGWDLKETWALTALIATAWPLHFRRVARSAPALALSMLLVCLLIAATFLALNPFGLSSLHTY